MRKIILYLGVATIAFVIGVATNSFINLPLGLTLEQPGGDALLAECATASLRRRLELHGVYGCSLVVRVDSNGVLYLNSTEARTLSDPSALRAMLRNIFEQREERHMYVHAPNLSSPVHEDRRIDKTVYVKAPPQTRYGEIVDLIEAIKEAGAEPVGLLVDQPLPAK